MNRPITLCLALASLTPSALADGDAAKPGFTDPGAKRVWKLLESQEPEASAKQMAETLLEEGPELIPALYSAWTGHRPSPSTDQEARATSPTRADAEREAMERALHQYRNTKLPPFLRFVAQNHPAWQERLRLVDLLRSLGDPRSTELLLELSGPFSAEEWRSPVIHGTVSRALQELLGKNPEITFAALRRQWKTLPVPLEILCLQAVTHVGGDEAIPFLLGRIGSSEAGDTLILTTTAWLVGEGASPHRTAVLRRVRNGLTHRDPEVLRAAVAAVAILHDRESTEPLLRLLEQDETITSRVAWESLQTLSGRRLPLRAETWWGWWEAERNWWQEIGSSLESQLESAAPEDCVRLVRDAATHPLYRHDLTDALEAALKREAPWVRSAACAALHMLNSETAIRPLVDALEDPHGAVRAVAYAGLRSITGLEVPPTTAAWSDALQERSRQRTNG